MPEKEKREQKINELRKELEPLKEDLNLRQEIEKKKDAELVVVNNSWW